MEKNISFVYAVCSPLPCCCDFQLKSMYFLKARSKFSFIQSCKNFVLIGFRKKMFCVLLLIFHSFCKEMLWKCYLQCCLAEITVTAATWLPSIGHKQNVYDIDNLSLLQLVTCSFLLFLLFWVCWLQPGLFVMFTALSLFLQFCFRHTLAHCFQKDVLNCVVFTVNHV